MEFVDYFIIIQHAIGQILFNHINLHALHLISSTKRHQSQNEHVTSHQMGRKPCYGPLMNIVKKHRQTRDRTKYWQPPFNL